METGRCASCEQEGLQPILALGRTPVADLLIDEHQLATPAAMFPLSLVFCPHCSLVQLGERLAEEMLYPADYPYVSSVSSQLVEHYRRNAVALIARDQVGPASLVVEIASNDGTMLRPFVERGIPVLGIDPAAAAASMAIEAGVPTLRRYFDRRVASELHDEGLRADLVLGNAVLNLVQDLSGFLEGVRLLLQEDGSAELEVPYVVDLVEKGAFDNVFHQNVSYFSLTSLDALLQRHRLHVNDVERVPTFGGSLRVRVQSRERRRASVTALLQEESRKQVHRRVFYDTLQGRAEQVKRRLLDLLHDLKRRGCRVAVYGAAGGMATTLLHFVGIDDSLADYAIDRNRRKHLRYMPGNRLKIFPPARLIEDLPDYVLLLAWNYEEEILSQQRRYLDAGGRFIVPIPELRLVSGSPSIAPSPTGTMRGHAS